ncbi:MAG: lactococcin 972 family bacteriocin [Streptococcaceae bacterium]|jgi:lactococcin 972 family bacteriocin|nr:lactococcin 972 family bacteriocin [Streptococcaceae bacterium]
MKSLKKIISLSVIALALSGGAVASATTQNAQGGTWNYGYNKPINAYSEYYHGYNKHGARVVNRNNGVTSTANQYRGVWARASINTIWDPASFYYNPTGFYQN